MCLTHPLCVTAISYWWFVAWIRERQRMDYELHFFPYCFDMVHVQQVHSSCCCTYVCTQLTPKTTKIHCIVCCCVGVCV